MTTLVYLECITVYHSVSQFITVYHSVSQCITYSVSQGITVYHSVSQCITVVYHTSEHLLFTKQAVLGLKSKIFGQKSTYSKETTVVFESIYL
jgi:hypothetical protein